MDDAVTLTLNKNRIKDIVTHAKAVYHKEDPDGLHRKALYANGAAGGATALGAVGLGALCTKKYAPKLNGPNARMLGVAFPMAGVVGGSMYAYQNRDNPDKAALGMGIAGGSLAGLIIPTMLATGRPLSHRLAVAAATTGILTAPALGYYANATSREATGRQDEFLDSPTGKKHPWLDLVDPAKRKKVQTYLEREEGL